MVSFEGEEAVLGVGNRFLLEWLKSRYIQHIEQAFEKVTGKKITIKFEIKGHIFRRLREKQLENKVAVEERHVETPSLDGPPKISKLRPEYMLENFIVGECNRVAYAASVSVVESIASKYNPLFIYSPTGLGKTHLLQGICHAYLSNDGRKKINYASCEEFTNLYVDSIQRQALDEFRFRFRRADVLVVDDIHFLAGKKRTQEEFFYTFDDLLNQGKQVIISSDAHPREISEMKDKLVSRFLSGLVVCLDYPDEQTRLSILQSKVKMKELKFSDDVLKFLAGAVSGNVRELEGALTRVAAYASCLGEQANISIAREALNIITSSEPENTPTIGGIVHEVAKLFEIQPADLRSHKRAQCFLIPRQVAMYLTRYTERYSLSEIGNYFGGKNHATVLHAVKKIAKSIKTDRELHSRVRKLARLLGVDIEEHKTGE